ncbi:MAG: biotin--[acetyl-CoA-carboxylase] ligase [Phycisphaerae bacterium]|nr:biotin--[acetyl-CoA-carboxylase] ligase [Phycisphaerae bacterium]NUQ46624.1 biotin--[acetyl-CoA-carboxylase] ligase [Phycisphaerae bacterium]
MSFQPLTAELVHRGLATRRIGRRIIVLPETGSTNDAAFECAARDGADADGLALFAEHQTTGRGRLGRAWSDRAGQSVLCSVALWQGERAREPLIAPALLSLAAGIAACRAIRESTGLTSALRWPNDVFLFDRKVAGVLIEQRLPRPGATGVTVIGVGINCLQGPEDFDAALRTLAASLAMHTAGPVDRAAVARALLAHLDSRLERLDVDAARDLVDEWRALSDDRDHRVVLSDGGVERRGRIVDIDDEGRLVFQPDMGGELLLRAETASIIQRLNARGEDSRWRAMNRPRGAPRTAKRPAGGFRVIAMIHCAGRLTVPPRSKRVGLSEPRSVSERDRAAKHLENRPGLGVSAGFAARPGAHVCSERRATDQSDGSRLLTLRGSD